MNTLNSTMPRARVTRDYFDYMAERLSVGSRGHHQPEVLEFTGFETIDVDEITMLPLDAASQGASAF